MVARLVELLDQQFDLAPLSGELVGAFVAGAADVVEADGVETVFELEDLFFDKGLFVGGVECCGVFVEGFAQIDVVGEAFDAQGAKLDAKLESAFEGEIFEIVVVRVGEHLFGEFGDLGLVGGVEDPANGHGVGFVAEAAVGVKSVHGAARMGACSLNAFSVCCNEKEWRRAQFRLIFAVPFCG